MIYQNRNNFFQTTRKTFHKVAKTPYKDLQGPKKTRNEFKRSSEAIHHYGGNEYAGGEFDEQMIHGNINWEDV